jgi:hypothetical protein
MSPQQEPAAELTIDTIPADVLKVTSRADDALAKERILRPVAEILPEKHSEAPEDELPETKDNEEDQLRESLPAPTDSDGGTAVVKPAKKSKKNKKKSHS